MNAIEIVSVPVPSQLLVERVEQPSMLSLSSFVPAALRCHVAPRAPVLARPYHSRTIAGSAICRGKADRCSFVFGPGAFAVAMGTCRRQIFAECRPGVAVAPCAVIAPVL